MNPLEVKDFSGGITDEFLGADPRFSQSLENLCLTPLGKPTQRAGTSLYNADAPQIPPGNQRIDAMHHFDSTLFVKSGTRLYYLNDGDTSWTTLSGPNGDAFKDSELGAGASFWEWKGHLFITPGPGPTIKSGCRTIKVYRNASSTWVAYQAGLPRAEDGTWGGVESDSGGVNTEVYDYVSFFVFTREYDAIVDGVTVTFKDFSSPVVERESNSLPREDTSKEWGTLTISNGAYDQYDTTNMKVALYRTLKNGTEPLFAKEVALGVQITDDVADASLGDPLYTNGDTPYNDPPPKCFFSDVVENYGFYYAGEDVDSGEFHNTRVFQSQPNDTDSVPAGNYTEVPGKLTARGHVGPYPVPFTDGRTYRIEGRYDAAGGGSMRAIQVDDSEGCPYPDSVVSTEDGIFFASRNGFCWTDGFTVKNLTEAHLRDTYAALTKTRIRGSYDKKNKRVLMTCEWSGNTATSGVNQAIFVIEARHSKPGQACVVGPFTSGEDLQANALCYKESTSEVLIGEQRGYVLKFDPTVTTDYIVDTGASASSWAKKGVVYDYRSAALDFGTSVFSKWVTRLWLVVKNLTGNLSFDLFSRNDSKDEDKVMKAVRERTTTAAGVHRLKRGFPKRGLRSLYKQVRIKKGYVNLFRSDDYDLVSTSNTLKTVLLTSGTWPNDGTDDLRGHYIYFDSDSYTEGFEITVQSGDTLTVSDSGGLLGTSSGRKWEIKGYPKNEKFELHALAFGHEVIGENYTAYQAGTDGTNQ